MFNMLRGFLNLESFLFVVLLGVVAFCFESQKTYATAPNPPSSQADSFLIKNFTGKYSFSSGGENYTAWFVRGTKPQFIYSFVIENSLIENTLSEMQDIAQNPARYMKRLCESSNAADDRARNMHLIWGFKADVIVFPEGDIKVNMSKLRVNQLYRLSYIKFRNKEYMLSEIRFSSNGEASELKFSPTGFIPGRSRTVALEKVSDEVLSYLPNYAKNYFKVQEHIFPNPDGCGNISSIFP